MNLFVYGTLLVPRIWSAVTRLPDHPSYPAELRGYSVFRVRGAEYPGIVESTDPDLRVSGLVFPDVPEPALRRLDAYEDTFYERRSLTVTTAANGEISAEAYCVRTEEACAILSTEPWTLDWFERVAFEDFWGRCFASGRVR